MSNRTKWTKQARKKFLGLLKRHGNATRAALSIGLSHSRIYGIKSEDPEFSKEWEDAAAIGLAKAEEELYRRAVRGVVKPVFGALGNNKGSGQIGTVREYSDQLLMFYLKGKKPDVYADRTRLETDKPLSVVFTTNA